MQGFYFDIETYSPGDKPDPKTDKIITIQFQKFDLESGEFLGRFQILREWESSEEEILKDLYKFFFTRNFWNFIPIGFNLNFEWKFLSEKFKKYGIVDKSLDSFFEMPQLDLKPIAIIKKGSFIGASLSSISNKEDDGNVIKEYYENKDFDKITFYIENEMNSFLEMYREVKHNL